MIVHLNLSVCSSNKNTPQEVKKIYVYSVFSHDVMAAILVSQNNETVAMLVSQTNPLGSRRKNVMSMR